MKYLIIFLFIINNLYSQCVHSFTSTTGYTINIKLQTAQVIIPQVYVNNCQYGYAYGLNLY